MPLELEQLADMAVAYGEDAGLLAHTELHELEAMAANAGEGQIPEDPLQLEALEEMASSEETDDGHEDDQSQGVEDHANEGLNHPQSSFILYLRGKR
ncbi:MAG: hypothetical protein O2821_04085 [Chloroflexi bacterium]|nr:hypothetical protein [Chloroflexota bacterium]MDA1227040.1 hypothetical protein [Chloroflexota bacterium]